MPALIAGIVRVIRGSAAALDPHVAFFHVTTFHGRPGDPMRGLLLPRIAAMGSERVIEGLAVDVLRVLRQMASNGRRQLEVMAVPHRFCSRGARTGQYAPGPSAAAVPPALTGA